MTLNIEIIEEKENPLIERTELTIRIDHFGEGIDSEEKRIALYQDLIWQKFLDVLNIKHILMMDILLLIRDLLLSCFFSNHSPNSLSPCGMASNK